MTSSTSGSSDRPIRNIIILGGGTAGWMAAAYLSRALNSAAPQATITLIESPNIGTIGVGEGTVPSIRPVLFDFLGIPEADWMAACNASCKLGIKFVNWATPPGTNGEPHYYHTFGEALEVNGVPLTHFWVRKKLAGYEPSFAHTCYPSAALCDADRAPCARDGEPQVPYAYHFDATLLGQFLATWAVERGVVYVSDEIEHVERAENGDIGSLRGRSGQTYAADLYLDCTGLTARLIEQTLHEPFLSYGDRLLCDRAVAIRVDPPADGRVRPYTTASAMDHGWTWEIDLTARSGTGYVYASGFVSDDEAEAELRRFLGPKAEGAPARRIQWRVGRMRRPWVGNCISLGLSAGFVEPLEATGVYFAFAALHHLVRYFPAARIAPALRDKYNERMGYMFDDVCDFLVLHYCTTRREDTPFWRTNRHDLNVPDRVRALLEEYRAGAPIKLPYTGSAHYNQLVFDASFDRFWTNSNYVAILAGMGVLPEAPMQILRFMPDAVQEAEALFARVQEKTAALLDSLPSHAEYLTQLRAAGR